MLPINRNSTLVLLLLLALCSGCKKEEAPAPQAAQPQPAQSAASAAPVQRQLSSATGRSGGLDFSKKTDPFRPPAAALPPPPVPMGQPSPQPGGDLLPIQSFEVGRFKVAGIIAGLKENRALLIDPNNKGYVVQAGMQVGNGGGRITRITASTVEVVERYKESSGRTKSRTIVLTLAKKR